MPARLPPSEALRSLQDEVQASRQLTSGVRSAEEAWSAFLRFGQQRFQTAPTPDADGLLFQYGTYSFNGPLMFSLDLTRQFDLNDADGEHDHYVQVHCEIGYTPTSALRDLGSFGSWFFHNTGGDFAQWAAMLESHSVWALLRELEPDRVELYEERV